MATVTDKNSPEGALVMERVFDAPAALVWQMWTEPEHFKAWYGPQGADIPIAKLDVRVGGARVVCMEMQSPSGPMQMWFGGEYREVVVHQRMVYSESMTDENGNLLSPTEMGMPESHPVTTEIIVELQEIGGKTKLTLTHVGVAPDSPGATGWAMALDKLAIAVKAQRSTS